jgi:hypothetical protein
MSTSPFMSDKDIEAAMRTLPKSVHKDGLMADLTAIRRDKFRVTRSKIFDGAVGIAGPPISTTLIVWSVDYRLCSGTQV